MPERASRSLPLRRRVRDEIRRRILFGESLPRERLAQQSLAKKLDVSRLVEAYDVRESVEGLAARRDCRHVSKSDLTALRAIADRTWNLPQEGKVDEMGTRIEDVIDGNMPDEAERSARQHGPEARRIMEPRAAKNDFALDWAVDSPK
jgi:DNA-binding GntR family transcriptional regulator